MNESSRQSHPIETSYVGTGRSYAEAAAIFEGAIGRLEPETDNALLGRHGPWADVEAEMARMAGSSGLMLFAKFDQGRIASLSGVPMRCRPPPATPRKTHWWLVAGSGRPSRARRLHGRDPQAAAHLVGDEGGDCFALSARNRYSSARR
jgi:hypothetical protein